MYSTPASGNSVTQRDIARVLGVSNATVSLALRDSESLTRERREEIQAAAKRMGYRPNPAAAELSRHKRHSSVAPTHPALAWIDVQNPAEQSRCDKSFDSCREGAEEAARKLGYQLEEFRIEGNVNPESLHRELEARSIRGIVLLSQDSHPDWGAFPWENYPVVRFGRSLGNPLCHLVSSDLISNAMLAFTKMRELGYQRIGFITDRVDVVRGGHLGETGFLIAQRLVDAEDRLPVCVVGEFSDRGRAKSVAKWVRENRVDAILTDIAQCPEILAEGGLRVPDDVGLACTNVMEVSVSAGIRQNSTEIGRVGVLMLHSLIAEKACGVPGIVRRMLLLGEWMDGDSLPGRVE
ncbi:MAG: LacI family DNA-binding transcriptional regulator [Luteolibacter sp.]